MDGAVVDTVQNVLQIGKSQYDSYVQERRSDRCKRITETLLGVTSDKPHGLETAT